MYYTPRFGVPPLGGVARKPPKGGTPNRRQRVSMAFFQQALSVPRMKPFPILLSVLLALSSPGSLAALDVPPGDLEKIRQAAPGEAPSKTAQPRRLLVFTLAKGFVHEATPWGVAALRIVGEKTGAYSMVASEEPEVFRRDSLARFDAVCFLNTCFTPFTNTVLQQNLMEFVKGGKGYVGIHCSAHTFLDWPEFGQLQGAYSVSHPWHEQVTVAIEEPEHPLMKCFGGNAFSISDEIYLFDQRYSRQRLRVLASLDTHRTDMTKPGITRDDADFGLVWVQRFGKGRAFYSAFGHDQPVFWDPTVLRHYLAGIQFACGDLAADTTPSAELPGYRPPPKPAARPGYRRIEPQPLTNGCVFPSMQFDGRPEGAVNTGDLGITGETTVAFWMRTPEPTNDRRLLSQSQGSTGQSGSLRLDAGQLQVWTPAGWQALVARGLVSNAWVHLAVVFGKDGQATAYRNARAQQAVPARFDFQGVEALIGGKFLGQWGNPYVGDLQDFRIYRQTIPAPEIERLRHAAAPVGADTADDAPPNPWAELQQYQFTGRRSVLAEVEGLVRESLADASRQSELEKRLLVLLEAPDTTAAAKVFLCWQLRLVGSASCVPAVASLLPNAALSHAARMVLQASPDPNAARALRAALTATSGQLLVGIINSVAARRDAQAVAALSQLATNDESTVASAAIAGLGRIGTLEAAGVLSALQTQSRAVQQRRQIADALLVCADTLLAAGNDARALAIYRGIFEDAGSPSAARLAGAVGLLTAQRQASIDTVRQFLGGADPKLRDIAIRHIRLLPGEPMTQKLTAGWDKLPPPAQVQLLHAVAERSDAAANAALIHAAASENQAVRLAALTSLARPDGTTESVALLVDAATARTGPEQAAARDSLIRVRGPQTDRALLALVDSGAASQRVEAIQAVGQRGLTAASTALLPATHDSLPSVRLAAIKALGQVAGSVDYPALIDLLTQAGERQEREEAARAVEAVALRIDRPEQRIQPLVDRMPQASVDTTTALLPILAALGGPTALQAVQSASQRQEAAIQDAAMRALANWPDSSALEVLRAIIPATTNVTHRKLALRGFIRLIGLPGERSAQQTVADYRQALLWATSLDEKKLILAGLAELRCAEALAVAEECARDSALTAEATLAIDQIRKALGR